ncbi:MAG: DUF2927 domain-containing protein [Pseudomonadota bacterium]
MNKIRTYLSIGFLVVTICLVPFGSVRAENLLSSDDLQIINKFENKTGVSFNEFFADAVHDEELCFETRSACTLPLNKFASNINFLLGNDGFVERDERIRRVGVKEAYEVRKTISRVTDFKIDFAIKEIDIKERATYFREIDVSAIPTENRKRWKEDFRIVHLLFVEQELIDLTSVEFYAKSWVSKKIFWENETFVESFISFYKSPLLCAGVFVTAPWDEDELLFTQIWIKSNISDFELTKCVQEELYNAMGPSEGENVPSVFDWPNLFNEEPGKLTKLHWLVLKILYMPQFEIGQSKDETRVEIAELIDASRK